ncbi:class C sortase [Actinomyces sp. W5033]|uniref:class C sortase n=1 Tax=Actinomyces sp. W5033 TaxID=3446479 RepID=UPI003EE35E4F
MRPRPRHHARAHLHRWRPSLASLLPALLATTGMLLLTYPAAASWLSQYNQSQVIVGYAQAVTEASPDAATQLAQAHAYNDALASGAVLEAGTHVPTGNGTSTATSLGYHALLDVNGSGLMARLRIPSIDLDLPVYHGTTDATLLQGLGHLEGTSLPVGGEGTRAVITGHRGLASATMFTHLDQVEPGDTFTLEVLGEVLTYRVTGTKVVEPEQTEALRAVEGKDLVTLVTCTPLGINSHRILVTGERVLPTPAQDVATAGAAPDVPGRPWWLLWLAVGLGLVALYVWQAGRGPAERGPAPRPGGPGTAARRTATGPGDTPERVDRVGGLTGAEADSASRTGGGADSVA